MRHMLLGVIVLSLAASAGADVYFEITGHGVKPIGMDNGGFPFFYTGSFDVYVWGSGADTSLGAADFDIAFQDIYGPEIQFLALGAVDPLNHFDFVPESAGLINSDRIRNVQLTSSAFVALPQTPSQALLLYEGLSVYFDGILKVVPNTVFTNTGNSPVIHSYRVITTPEPMAMTTLLAGMLLASWRRARDR